VRKLKIGYWPLSSNLQAAGDRRRLVFWARARGHEIVTDLSQRVDVLFASEKTDFNSTILSKSRAPIIFDLIDAYLSPLNILDDLGRGLAKKLSGEISGEVKPFSKHVEDFCLRSSAVICSSVEQEKVINSFNQNTHVILDSHDEIPLLEPSLSDIQKAGQFRILWEGQPATIRGVGQISSTLSRLATSKDLNFDFVTDESYFQFLGKFLKRSTLTLLTNDLNAVRKRINIIPWSPENLVRTARTSSMAMIPINLSVPMQWLKPENRLLIMWRLGLPCLCSPSPAYMRVSNLAGVRSICYNESEWFINFSHILEDPDFALEEVSRGQNFLLEYHNKKLLLEKWDRAFESVIR
jgi:hypothetical protein